MTFAAPLGLLALLAIPAIVAIHLFRRRFPVRPVAGLFLWQIGRQTPEAGRRIDRLPITASLILECIAALALALILAGARLSSADVSAHLVVLLDGSASMAAINGRGESTRDRVVRRVIEELDRLGSSTRVTLVESGERPSVLLGPAARASEAGPALEGWRPEAPHHSLALGLRLARELAGQTGRLIVMSDADPRRAWLPPSGGSATAAGDFRLKPEATRITGEATRVTHDEDGVFWVSLGEPLANVGITAAERTLTPAEGQGTVSLTLGNYSDSPARRRVTVVAGDKEVLTRDLEAPPGVSSLTIPLPAALPVVRVALSDDAMARDNAVTLAEPRPRIVGVDNRLPDGRGRQALVKALEAVSGVTPSESSHLVFAEAGQLDRAKPPGVWRVGFGRAPAAWLAKGEPHDFIGPFVLEKRHPLLLGITLGGVVWSGAVPLAAGAVRPVVTAGDQALVGMPDASAGTGTEPAILFNLDLDRTNLIRSPDWPILISNLVEMRRQSLAGPERWNYRVGEWVRVRLAADSKRPLRLRSGAVERPFPPGRELEFIAPSPGGLLQILEGSETIGGNDTVLFELGVNFLDESESDLRDRQTAAVGRFTDVAAVRAESGPESDPLFWLLLTIGATAMVANWCLRSPALNRGGA